MKYASLLIALSAGCCAIFAISAIISSGCYYQNCDCPPTCDGEDGGADGGGDSDIPVECQAPAEDVNLNAYIEGCRCLRRRSAKVPALLQAVDPDANDIGWHTVRHLTGLDENPSHLPPADQQVIGPLDHGQKLGARSNGVAGSDSCEQAQCTTRQFAILIQDRRAA